MVSVKDYKLNFLTTNLTKNEYSYHITKNNSQQENNDIISNYIDYGDYIETDFLKEDKKSKKIRQIAHILLKRYLDK